MTNIALGTAQFGLNYGISNKQGLVSINSVRDILDVSWSSGIRVLDTARAYGKSESVLGSLLSAGDPGFKIISKLPQCTLDAMESEVGISLSKLGKSSIYGMMFHNFEHLKSNWKKWDELERIRQKGLFVKSGISLYHPSEWFALCGKGIIPGIVQIPFSILDQRFSGILGEMKKAGVEIHVRSVFLQGFYFLDRNQLDPFFSSIAYILDDLSLLGTELELSRADLCTGFVSSFDEIDYIVMGVENKDNVNENCRFQSLISEKIALIKRKFSGIEIEDERMVLPYLWPKK